MMNFLEIIENISDDRIAVVHGNNKITYTELNALSSQIAHFLNHELKLRNHLIGVMMKRGIPQIAVITGILKSGNAYLPLDETYPEQRLDYMLKISQCKWYIVDEEKKSHLAENFNRLNYNDLFLKKERNEVSFDRKFDESGSVYVIFTSGSTGQPKGVEMPFSALNNLILWQLSQSGKGLKTLYFAPVSFDVSFQEIFSTLASGGSLIIADESARTNPEVLAKTIVNHGVERIFLPFVALQILASYCISSATLLSSVREVITSGEQLKITPQIREFFRQNKCSLANQYGPTESHVITQHMLKAEDSLRWPDLPPVGKPIDNCKVLILNEDKEAVETGQSGELFLGGICLARGYIHQPELTKEKFIEIKGERFYRSGDLGRLNSDGEIEFLGRTDDQVKIRGYRIETGEIEVQLSALPDISGSAVKVIENQDGVKMLAGFFVSNKKQDILKLKAMLAKSLPEYMIPSILVQVEKLPLTPSGKVDKKNLHLPVIQRSMINMALHPPVTPLQTQLAGIWKSLLLLDEIGIDDNLFDLGANSLICIQVSLIFEEKYGKKLPVVKIYQYPDIRRQADFLEHQEIQKQPVSEMNKKLNSEFQKDIAVIGMALRVPGAENIQKFWQNLIEGKESITFFTDNDLDPSIPDSMKSNPDYVKARGIIEDAETFDYEFFGINEKLAALMDPQQRKFLEVAWECIENAGINIDRIRHETGVFAGCGNNTYYLNNVLHHPELIAQVGEFQVMTLNEKDYIATKTTYQLDLKGPAISVYTACSTSLTAVALACESLRLGKCSYALAGGSSITSPVKSGYLYNEGAMLSKDGRCRPFDADASGTPFSDGVGVVLLKRFDEAVRDKDYIYAVIKGVGINNDGADKASFTAPSVNGQAGAISSAIADAGIDPDSISYIEAHGTGTPLGDPIEMEALNMVYSRRKADKVRYIGSVKSNFGHLTPAAGVVGLIKTALALKNKIIPPSINFKVLNPAIDFDSNKWQLPVKALDWQEDFPRRAGISSFGVGGTNVHVILEEAPEIEFNYNSEDALWLLSAKSEAALNRKISELSRFIHDLPGLPVEDIAYTLAVGRKHFSYRKFFVVSRDDLNPLGESNKLCGNTLLKNKPDGIVFMFPGQGSQFPGMCRYLYENIEFFRHEFDRCLQLVANYSPIDLKEAIFQTGERNTAEILLKTEYTQPALFIVEYCLAKLLMHYGIIPDVLMGHSVGEFTAACLAGIFSLEDAVKLIITRAQLMQNMPEGKMIAVKAGRSVVDSLLGERIDLASINTDELYVLSGPEEDILNLAAELDRKGIPCSLLHTSHAFHSQMMNPVLEEFKPIVQQVRYSIPRIPVLSTVTADWLPDHLATDPDYWLKHLRVTVRFGDAVSRLAKEGNYCCIEVGPRNVLSILTKQQLKNPNSLVFSSLGEETGKHEWLNILKLSGNLWINGINPDFNILFDYSNRQKLPLPVYPFQKNRCWIEAGISYTGRPELLKEETVKTELSYLTEKATDEQNTEEIVRNILEESSGISLKGIFSTTTFAELGLDSLFLTQIALSIQKKTGVKVSFRQLNEELNSIGSLTNYIKNNIIKTVKPIPADIQADKSAETEEPAKKPFGAIARIETRKTLHIPDKIAQFIKDFSLKYNQKTRLSKEYTQKYRKVLADPRVVTGFKPYIKELVYQVVTRKSKGCRLWDIDGNEYIDILNGFGSNFFGYAHPEITRSIRKLARNGYEIGPQHHLAGETVRMICEITGNERAALCNTGSEAVLGLIRIARTVSGKSKVVMFNGSYHGINDEVIVRGGKQLHSYPAAPGIPPEAVKNTLILDYGENKSLKIIEEQSAEIAAVLVEPVQSRRPEFQPFEFLRKLRNLCSEREIILIFDEVITGFRSHPAGVQGITGIKADLTSYGKVPGGGMPIGIMAGKAELMDTLDGGYWQFGDESIPEKGVTYFAGTFVRHPLTLAAAYSALKFLEKGGASLQELLNQKTRMMVEELNSLVKRKNIPMRFNYFASLFRPVFIGDIPFTELLFPLLRYHGVHVLEGFPCFLTLAHSDKDIQLIIKAFDKSLSEMQNVGIFEAKVREVGRLGNPPVPGARLGKDPEGNPGWYIPDPENPGRFLRIEY